MQPARVQGSGPELLQNTLEAVPERSARLFRVAVYV
jgi:hypothetical protein